MKRERRQIYCSPVVQLFFFFLKLQICLIDMTIEIKLTYNLSLLENNKFELGTAQPQFVFKQCAFARDYQELRLVAKM